MRINLFLSISTLLLVIFFFSCGSPTQVSEAPDVNETETVVEDCIADFETVSEEETETTATYSWVNGQPQRSPGNVPDTEPIKSPRGAEQPKLEDYEITLDVDTVIRYNRTGTMTVWIGNTKYKPVIGKGTGRDSIIIEAKIGQYAKITPIAAAFDIEPKQANCIKIDPSGSFARFILSPQKGLGGETRVSVVVELFEGENCTGASIPKATKELTVKVIVKPVDLLWIIFDVIWDNFIVFLGSLLGLLATIVLFKIRKKAKIDEKNIV